MSAADGELPVVERADVDGVPVFWVDTPGRLHAELVFGVGLADESFLTTGITHLVEHLVMRRLDEPTHRANAGVSPLYTSFEVTGSPARVVGYLRRLCECLGELDVTDIDLERGIIGAEEDKYGASVLSWWPLALRYGNRGPGLVGNRQLAPVRCGPAEVQEWGRARLHRGNAALVLHGPPPEGLALPLPDGPPVGSAWPAPVHLPTPSWTTAPLDGVVAAFHGEWTAGVATGLQVLTDRVLRGLRHESGLVYEVGQEAVHLPGGAAAFGVGVEVPDQHVPTAVECLLDTLDALCADGPTPAELDRDREELLEALDDRAELARAAAFDRAVEHLRGLSSGEDDRARVLAGLDPAEVVAELGSYRRSLLLGVPEGHALQRLPELPACPISPVVGRSLGRAVFGSSVGRGGALTLAPDGVTMVPERGAPPLTVLFADVVGVGVEPGPRGPADEVFAVVSGPGDSLLLRARDWRDGGSAIEALRAAVPPGMFYEIPENRRLFS